MEVIMPKDNRVNLRLSDDVYANLKSLAELYGVTASSLAVVMVGEAVSNKTAQLEIMHSKMANVDFDSLIEKSMTSFMEKMESIEINP